MDQDLLLRNGFVAIATPTDGRVDAILYSSISLPVATVISNLATYGYVVDRKALDALYTTDDLSGWWESIEPVLKSITGADRNMDEFMVYKNFPREVLEMSVATSVIRQMLIYWGIPYDLVREKEEPREPLGEVGRLKVLTLADDNTSNHIYQNLVAMRNRWSDNQLVWAGSLVGDRNAIVCSEFGFKENAIRLAAANFETKEFEASSATDVLRLSAALSGGDISLRERVKFRGFKRAERRRLLAVLDTQSGIAEDMATRPGPWKRLMEHLRPNDYKFHLSYLNVSMAYNALYNKKVKSFGALADPQQPTLATLDVLATRPGEFLRRFHRYYDLFGRQTVDCFLPVMEKLSTRQLAGFRGYLRTINDRKSLIYPPNASWARARVVENKKGKIATADRRALDTRISRILTKRLDKAFPEGIALDMRVDQVRLQSNDQKLAEYGRGTEFDIPKSVSFMRTASYWENAGPNVTWFDNGWNLFNENWSQMGACCWNSQIHGKAAVFSGDPINIKDLKGRACQMIDLYLDRLAESGVRYAVWSLLCYSRVPFSKANEVLATLQMGDKAQTGKRYEPSRAQMVFPIKSETYSNFVAYIDIKRRKLVYMDVALPSQVQSAASNCSKLAALMPAYVEYLASLPTLMEVLQDAPAGKLPVLYDDVNHKLRGDRAYVFRPANAENTFERVSLTDLVNV